MKTVFFGSSRLVVPILDTLRLNSELKLVITTELGSQDPIPFYCKMHKIEYLSLRKSAQLVDSIEIIRLAADLGVVADFGLIIPEKTLKHFSFGMINIHPSYLPKYRGATPVQAAILNGDKKTGITIIELDKHVDHGPIITQVEEDIKAEDTAKNLYERLFKKGAEMLPPILQDFQNQKVKFTIQDEKDASFTKTLTKEDGFIQLKKMNSEKELFSRMVKAFYPWPGVWTRVKLNESEAEKLVKFLPEDKIQVEGGREISYKDFANGYPNADENLLGIIKK